MFSVETTMSRNMFHQIINFLGGIKLNANLSYRINVPGNSLCPFWDGEVTLSKVK